MRRYREIDILRGFAIVLVIFGHAIVVYPVNLMNVAWCKSAFSFVITLHMPIFFGVAVFCFHQNKSYIYIYMSDRRQSAPRNFRFSEHFSLCL